MSKQDNARALQDEFIERLKPKIDAFLQRASIECQDMTADQKRQVVLTAVAGILEGVKAKIRHAESEADERWLDAGSRVEDLLFQYIEEKLSGDQGE